MILKIIILGLLFCSAFYFIYNDEIKDIKDFSKEKILEKKFQGPVPEGYNETHFRKTGETIKNGN